MLESNAQATFAELGMDSVMSTNELNSQFNMELPLKYLPHLVHRLWFRWPRLSTKHWPQSDFFYWLSFNHVCHSFWIVDLARVNHSFFSISSAEAFRVLFLKLWKMPICPISKIKGRDMLLLLRFRMDEGYLTGELSFIYKGWQAYTRFYWNGHCYRDGLRTDQPPPGRTWPFIHCWHRLQFQADRFEPCCSISRVKESLQSSAE